jgi:hypothetical protein
MTQNIIIQKYIYDELPKLRTLNKELQHTVEQKTVPSLLYPIQNSLFLEVDRIFYEWLHLSGLNGIYF